MGQATRPAGVTLLELLIVITLIAIVSAVTFPTASAGLDSLRLRSATDKVVSILNLAIDRADALQQVIEIRVSLEENAISARSTDLTLNRTLKIDQPIRIISAGLALPPSASASADAATGQRRYLLYPGGAPPRISIELQSPAGRKRRVSVDPISGSLHADAMNGTGS